MIKRYATFGLAVVLTALSLLGMAFSLWFLPAALIFGAVAALGVWDVFQRRHSILRNYPVLGHMRFVFEGIRPEIRQYLIESDSDEEPFSRDERSLVYQRAKDVEDKRPFGTKLDVYGTDFAWMTHSIVPVAHVTTNARVMIGGPDCRQPYEASIYNISAMSFGALSPNAIKALNEGAKRGGFAHNTGEGGISRYHRQGGDLIYQIGSGYFGCRAADGTFDAGRFVVTAADPQVKMIELKLSQGAKPGHGGVLPAAKISPEIAEARGIAMGADCVSPAAHSAFSTPIEMMEFIAQLREEAGGKPVGFKLCIGHRREFMCIAKAMLETGITPDFITVDGKEGGTGAAPLEFANHIGMPLEQGLYFVHNTLLGAGLRDRIRIAASGKLVTGFEVARILAMGADWVNSARGFMFSLGCIQAQACHTNKCPVGIATQDKSLARALDTDDKAQRVANFHHNTVEALVEMAAAAGLTDPRAFLPHHFMQRDHQGQMISGDEAYPYLPAGFLLEPGEDYPDYRARWGRARAESFGLVA
ncbi:FMN-binding glutamate synthase family protein [Parvularcula marina]|uniref:FMN-binding glutamate synthase family protein n=1 Tax=Parvularcula marina TaxID=2292771 RepID=A0A371RFJ4_9PROT|nr:FMN-binding glutamate synthase family protein [Parvularcula marina]RFB04234.1 FMN-binding glutamate synthase family protein [Parvularcula marina]